jgi:hypothetical protein
MPNKKVISAQIISSDPFVKMSKDAQILYIHMLYESDSDGFVQNVEQIMRAYLIRKKALQELIDQRFLICIRPSLYLIKHWWVHESKREGRYKPSTYHDFLNNYTETEGKYVLKKTIENPDKMSELCDNVREKSGKTPLMSKSKSKFNLSNNQSQSVTKEDDSTEKKGIETITDDRLTGFLKSQKVFRLKNTEIEQLVTTAKNTAKLIYINDERLAVSVESFFDFIEENCYTIFSPKIYLASIFSNRDRLLELVQKHGKVYFDASKHPDINPDEDAFGVSDSPEKKH